MIAPPFRRIMRFTNNHGSNDITITAIDTTVPLNEFSSPMCDFHFRVNGTDNISVPLAEDLVLEPGDFLEIACTYGGIGGWPIPPSQETGVVQITHNADNKDSPFIVNFPFRLPWITGLNPDSGPAGTIVEITGFNFQTLPIDEININSIGGNVTVAAGDGLTIVDDNTMELVMPANPGSTNIVGFQCRVSGAGLRSGPQPNQRFGQANVTPGYTYSSPPMD